MRNGPYELVVAPPEYPGRLYRGRYVYEHHLVWWQSTGTLVPVGHLLHHANGKKRDNRRENLELKERGEHTRGHAKPAPVVLVECGWCKKPFERFSRIVRHRKTRGQRSFFCSRQCGAKRQWADGRISTRFRRC